MIAPITALFKYKLVSSVIVLACWPPQEQAKCSRELYGHGIKSTFLCDLTILKGVPNNHFLGILVFEKDFALLAKTSPWQFSAWYKWLIAGDSFPKEIVKARYDSDISYYNLAKGNNSNDKVSVYFDDIFITPKEVSSHSWATWNKSTGLKVHHQKEKLMRRANFKQERAIRIALPIGHFANPKNQIRPFEQYLRDQTHIDLDTSIKCSYGGAVLITDALNATSVVLPQLLWAAYDNNQSMLAVVAQGRADLSGLLRMQKTRAELLDYVLPLWPFRVGFTYLAERQSSGSMFLEPFDGRVWWCCLGTGLVLAIMQRITSRRRCEKDEAFYSVLATCLQQDIGAVPKGISGRWTFVVVSLSAMLIYAYYSSAIVSALMSSETSGPTNFRELADSKYAIASEDYDYMRYQLFDNTTSNDDLEYLKRKKMKRNFYQPLAIGFQMIRGGETAYHTEYISIYSYLRTLTDSEVCKLAYIDTIPLILSWLTAPKRSELTEVLRIKSTWLLETGLKSREVSLWLSTPAPCKTSMLAERVKFGDIVPLIGISVICVLLSLLILAAELLFAMWFKKNNQ